MADLLARSPELRPNIWNPLQEDDLQDALYMILEALQQADYADPTAIESVSRLVLEYLKDAVEEDKSRVATFRDGFTRHSQRRFRALAEVSHDARN